MLFKQCGIILKPLLCTLLKGHSQVFLHGGKKSQFTKNVLSQVMVGMCFLLGEDMMRGVLGEEVDLKGPLPIPTPKN